MYNKDFILLDTHLNATGPVSASVVFVAYVVSAPEFGCDNYARVDVKAKILALLFFEAPASLPGTERALYRDPQVKREIAIAHGSVGIIEINTPEMQQNFPWNSMLREVKIGFNSLRWLDSHDHPFGLNEQLKARAFLNRSGAAALLACDQHCLEDVFGGARAGKPGSFSLKKTVSIQYNRRHTSVNSLNVICVLPGSDVSRLDKANRSVRVLIIKTNMTLPYTSVFLKLDCAYWSADAERRLRSAISREPKK